MISPSAHHGIRNQTLSGVRHVGGVELSGASYGTAFGVVTRAPFATSNDIFPPRRIISAKRTRRPSES